MNQPIYTWESRGIFVPKINIFKYTGKIKTGTYKTYLGYDIWLRFFHDVAGYCIKIHYPSNPKKGNNIKVFFEGAFIKKYIEWVHGEAGLVKQEVLPLLFKEWFLSTAVE